MEELLLVSYLQTETVNNTNDHGEGFVDQHALILYVYLQAHEVGGEESVLTYYISSYSM